MKDLEEGLKELKAMTTPSHYLPPASPLPEATCLYRIWYILLHRQGSPLLHMCQEHTWASMRPSIYMVEDCLVWLQWEKMCLILDKLEVPRREKSCGGRSTLLEARGRRNGMQNCGRDE